MNAEDLTDHTDGEVRIDADRAHVTTTEAQSVLEKVIAEGCEKLHIQGQQMSADELGEMTVKAWCEACGQFENDELHTVVVDTPYLALTMQASVRCGDITPIFEGAPNLRFAHVMGVAEVN